MFSIYLLHLALLLNISLQNEVTPWLKDVAPKPLALGWLPAEVFEMVFERQEKVRHLAEKATSLKDPGQLHKVMVFV